MIKDKALTSCRRQLTYNNRRQKDKRTKKTKETIGLFSGVLLFSVLCLLPEVRAKDEGATVLREKGVWYRRPVSYQWQHVQRLVP